MKTAAFVAVAAAFAAAGCVSGPVQQQAGDEEACRLGLRWPGNGVLPEPSPQSGPSAKMGRENPLTSKANCTSNRAEAQLVFTRMEQRRNEMVSFPAESPAPN